MKKLKFLYLVFLMLTDLVTIKLSAQIPGAGQFDIINSTTTGCHLEMRWDVMGFPTCPPTNNVCLGTTGTPPPFNGQVLLPNSTMINITTAMVTASCGGNACDLVIVLLGPGNGVYFNNPYTIILTTAPTTGGFTEVDCNGNSHSYTYVINNSVPFSITFY